MTRKIEKCSLTIINKLSIILKSNEYHVASQIINRMAMNKKDKVKLFRGSLAYYCNMSERNITRITDKLNEKGIIEKQLIGDAEKKKTFNIYCINWDKLFKILAKIDDYCTEIEENSAQNVRLNELYENNEIIEKNEILENFEKKEENEIEDIDEELLKEYEKAIEKSIYTFN